ncbi:MAG TPA: HDIG domain-containing protein, partial [Chloroflexota bacterium]
MVAALHIKGWTPSRLRNIRTYWLALVCNAVVLVGLLVALYTAEPRNVPLRAGSVAEITVVSPHRVAYTDHVATAARRQAAAALVPTVDEENTGPALQRRAQALTFLNQSAQVIASSESSPQKLRAIQHLLPTDLAGNVPRQYAALRAQDLSFVRLHALDLLNQALEWPYDSSQKVTTEIGLLSTLPPGTTFAERNAVGEVLQAFLTPTLVPNVPATDAKRRQAAASVAPVKATLAAGQVIVRRGDVVTQEMVDQVRALGQSAQRGDWHTTAAGVLFSILLVTMLFWYLWAFHRPILENARMLLLIDAGILISVAAVRLLESQHVLLPLFVPVAAAPTFAAVLIAPEACIAIAFAMAALSGWIAADSFELCLYYFLTSAAGVMAVRHVKQLKQFVLAGAYIALFALPTALAFDFLSGGSHDLAAYQEYALAAGFNGFVSATLALGGFALLSGFFGVTTSLQLLELGQPGQALLRQLMIKAPGTYNHSVVVASMVEHAADEIGANALVARISALYHDIGKSTNPTCFVENQMGMGNIHDGLRPEESARLIRSHVIHGLRLARQHRLPRVILDAIGQHHGTMTISYFLHKARTEYGEEAVESPVYTYPGPKPQTRETALLMLADACESAVRSGTDHSNERIREVMEGIFEDRIRNGQLDESPLTLKDLDGCRRAFFSVLSGLYHPRIEYPEPPDVLSLTAARAARTGN